MGRRTYQKLRYEGEDYEDAVFVNGEFRYGWIPTSANMRNLMVMERRQQIRIIDGHRRVKKEGGCKWTHLGKEKNEKSPKHSIHQDNL